MSPSRSSILSTLPLDKGSFDLGLKKYPDDIEQNIKLKRCFEQLKVSSEIHHGKRDFKLAENDFMTETMPEYKLFDIKKKIYSSRLGCN